MHVSSFFRVAAWLLGVSIAGPCLLAGSPDPDAGGAKSTAPALPELKKPRKDKPDPLDEYFNRGPIPRLRIELSPENLNKLRQDARAYVSATVRETPAAGPEQPEVVYEKVAVHLKGAAGSFRGVDDKPGLTLNFERLSPGRLFHGLSKFHLNNCVQDPSYMSEDLGNSIFRAAGIPAARVTYARVSLNGRELGLFALKEAFDDIFLKRYFPGPRGTLYEGPYRDVDSDLTERVNKDRKDFAKLKELVAASREGDPAKRRQRLEKVLDVDRFLTFMAVEALTAHWDGYCPNRNNYRVYDDGATGKLVFLPHGTDQLFQQPGYPLMHANALVAQALCGTVEDRARYLERVAELRKKVFTPEQIGARLDEISTRLAPVAEAVGADAARQHRQQTEEFHRRIDERIKNIDQQLASQPRPLKFDAGGIATLAEAQWRPQEGGGKVTLDRPEKSGRQTLHLRVEPGGGDAAASFRTTVLLTRGRYTFEAPCRTSGVKGADGNNTAAGLRISGGQRSKGLTGNTDWQPARFEFEVTDESRDVVLVCELKARAGEAWFDTKEMKLLRRE